MTDQKTGRTTPKQNKGVPGSPTSASAWKAKTAKGTLITVPSGNTALVRAPGMEAFLENGMIPNDLAGIVRDSMSKGKAPDEDDLSSLLENRERIAQIIELANSVVVDVCIDPKVAPKPYDEQGELIPINDSRRDGDILYVDEVDFNDKMFIFSFAVGGTSHVEKFREEQAAYVERLQSRENVVDPT